MTRLILINLFLVHLTFNVFCNNIDSINILHYDINLDIIDFKQAEIKGYTEVKILPLKDNITKINLSLQKLNIDSINYSLENINFYKANYTYNDTLISIYLHKSIISTDTISVRVYYHGKPEKDLSGWGGFYFTTKYAYNIGVGIQTVPPSIGRFWFPCIDDFKSKALYDFHIRTRNNNFAVCNGTLMKTNDNNDNTKTYHWKLNNKIPAYLASVAVSDYVAVEDTLKGKKNIPISIYVSPQKKGLAEGTFKNLKNILGIYEDYFGKYKWERVGYVAVPFTAGAMEHATNIAFPDICINGTLDYEDLAAHELSHHWFGNLVTCTEPADMWLNEGWASFCEHFYREILYGKKSYKDAFRENHKYVLQTLPPTEGYHPVYGLSSDLTYSSTVYKKGADVVHTFRNYIGDTAFFRYSKEFLEYYSYSNANTEELKNFFSIKTGINLDDFFNTWVYSKGFPHFSVDSFSVQNNSVKVYIKQRLKELPEYAKSNRVEITFLSENWESYTDTINFSGEFGEKEFTPGFKPLLVMLDKEEKISDARTSLYRIINKIGNYPYANTFFKLDVNEIQDSGFVRITHNWLRPENNENDSIKRTSERYWQVETLLPEIFLPNAGFQYNRSSDNTVGLDYNFMPKASSIDSLVLLYRENHKTNWKIIKTTKPVNAINGYIYTDYLRNGEYCLGISKFPLTSVINNSENTEYFKIYPNPSKENCVLDYKILSGSTLKIYDRKGSIIDSMNLAQGNKRIIYNLQKLDKAGLYHFKIFNAKGNLLLIRNFIKTR